MGPPPALAHHRMTLRRAVVPCTEPLIERDCAVATVVALEIAVVQVVEVALANTVSVAVGGFKFVKPAVRDRRC